MEANNGLFVSGIVLLSLAALTGFAQHRHRERPEVSALWRVAHVGGTAGAVQLLALASVWQRFGQGRAATLLEAGLIIATLAFFLGPLARALGEPRAAGLILLLGALLALPTYLALPLLLLA